MSPREGMPIEGSLPKDYQLWEVDDHDRKHRLLAEGDALDDLRTSEGGKWRPRGGLRTKLYYHGKFFKVDPNS